MITLASDFGDPYPAAMKGVLARQCDADLVDVSHRLDRQDVRGAAFWLRFVLPEFPPAVHLVVVDPGVGTDRAALVVRAGDHALVGPDNGVLLPAARALADGGPVEAFEWRYEYPASSTFHGRDVFAPAAAAVHGVGPAGIERLDPTVPLVDPVDLTFPEPTVADGTAEGEVLVVDDFGNVVTNVPGSFLEGRETVAVDGEAAPVVGSYARVEAGERLVTVGSHGNVELAVNRGRGDTGFGVSAGSVVRLS